MYLNVLANNCFFSKIRYAEHLSITSPLRCEKYYDNVIDISTEMT